MVEHRANLIAGFPLSFSLLFVIFRTTEKNASPAMACIAIGLFLALIHMVIPITFGLAADLSGKIFIED